MQRRDQGGTLHAGRREAAVQVGVRLFVEADLAPGAEVPLDPAQAHYLRNVMRREPGEAVRVFNGRDGEWRGVIAALGKGKGALAKMVPPFKLFAGGRLGSGKQWFPWIHLDDEAGLIKFLIDNEKADGPFNATAPNPVTMDEFCRALGKVLNRPSWAPVPASLLSLMLGEMAEMLLTGQRALPAAALKLGYQFKYQNVFDALASLKL